MKQIKAFLLGVLVTVLLSSTVVFAAGTQIEVVFSDLKYMFDGVEKKPSTGEGFIYEGTTYVPLRFVSEALGKDVSWDGKNSTIWVGGMPGSFIYLTDLEYARKDQAPGDGFYFNEKNAIPGEKAHKSIGVKITDGNLNSIDYNLNGEFKELTGKIGISDYFKNSKKENYSIWRWGRVIQKF
ncbi:copper amine oxidase N-terminal domain-containing protein [Chengkuizengella axinellae]|uniref:Copper amine oxidase N-terminal domain-containing protein n=1 Tax=Chengkuizengella axinellae TaxID=3064388 RepID=A0ABT9J0K5_9BACL|nr:copper amine oxidase N-terminal domain-containing protein [Chengkuizengella sp. 2205SS18-9]MDP5275103.1 copper amine oxidase N-terminal domain-containing protein [Chengkuizengella sp. 2205SS18-9]